MGQIGLRVAVENDRVVESTHPADQPACQTVPAIGTAAATPTIAVITAAPSTAVVTVAPASAAVAAPAALAAPATPPNGPASPPMGLGRVVVSSATFGMVVRGCAGDPVALRNVTATLAPQVSHVAAATVAVAEVATVAMANGLPSAGPTVSPEGTASQRTYETIPTAALPGESKVCRHYSAQYDCNCHERCFFDHERRIWKINTIQDPQNAQSRPRDPTDGNDRDPTLRLSLAHP